MIAALKDKDSGVRYYAAEALVNLKDARAVEPLIATLKDENASVRESAAEALGNLKDARAIEPLVEALKDKSFNVQRSAAEALVNVGPAVKKEILEFLTDPQNYAQKSLDEETYTNISKITNLIINNNLKPFFLKNIQQEVKWNSPVKKVLQSLELEEMKETDEDLKTLSGTVQSCESLSRSRATPRSPRYDEDLPDGQHPADEI